MASSMDIDFSDVYLQMPCAVCIKDTEGTSITGNQGYADIIGLKRAEDTFGINDFDSPWVNYADNYVKHDQDAFNGLIYSQLDPMETFQGFCVVHARKAPLLDKDETSKAVIAVGNIIEDRELINFLHALDKSSPLFNGRSITVINNDYMVSRLNHLNLSVRESECLFFILRGRSSKNIGEILGLSARTIEHYTENIKDKFGCYKKSELIDKATTLGLMRCIPQSILEKKLTRHI